MEQFREIIETMGSRVKSPIFGSIAISFAIINWKPLAFLLFSESDLQIKFLFFDNNTNATSLYFFPALLGLTIGLLAPWISFIGAISVSFPINQQRLLSDRLASERLEAKTTLQREREKAASDLEEAAIQRAKRDSEVKDIGDPKIREDLRNEIDLLRHREQSLKDELEAINQNSGEPVNTLDLRVKSLRSELAETIQLLHEAEAFASQKPTIRGSEHREVMQMVDDLSQKKNKLESKISEILNQRNTIIHTSRAK